MRKNINIDILTALSISGVVVTAVLTAKATPKAILLMEEKQKQCADEGKECKSIDKIVSSLPAYIPAIVTGCLTIGTILSVDILSIKQQRAAISAYALMNDYHTRYRQKVIELGGKELDEQVMEYMTRERCDHHIIGLDFPDVKMTFLEPISGHVFEAYEREVLDAEYHFNRNFVLGGGEALLNEFYAILGIPLTDDGDILGWDVTDGIMWIDFEHEIVEKDDGGYPVCVINIPWTPTELIGVDYD